MRISISRAVAIAGLLGASCAGGGSSPDAGSGDAGSTVECQTDPRVTAYNAGMSATSTDGTLTATLMSSDPAPPANSNNTWTVELTDGSGNPISGATLGVVPTMPYMGHGTPIHPEITPQSGGVYAIDDINLFMAGIWEVTISVTTPSNSTAEVVQFFFCVQG